MSEQIFIQGPVGKIELLLTALKVKSKALQLFVTLTHYKVELLNIKSLLFKPKSLMNMAVLFTVLVSVV